MLQKLEMNYIFKNVRICFRNCITDMNAQCYDCVNVLRFVLDHCFNSNSVMYVSLDEQCRKLTGSPEESA